MCSRCGRPFVSPHGLDHPCGDCRAISFDFHFARAAGRYEGVLRTLIHGLKYQGCVQLAVPLGRLLWTVFLTYWDPVEVDAVVPIPLHPKRLRSRGFNQAYQLIRHWPRFAGIEGAGRGCPELRPEWLRRSQPTIPQTGLPQRQREANVKHAFELGDAEGAKEHRLVLIDDVMTTGATAQACTRLLKRAGAARVDVLTLARAV